MATESAYPQALPTLADVPATFAELPKHSTQHNVNNADTVAIATKLGTSNTFKGVERYANAAARDADITSPTADMLAIVDGTLQKNVDGTTGGWVDLAHEPVRLEASDFTAAAGWSIGTPAGYIDSTRTLWAVFTVQRTGAALTVNSDGQLATASPILTASTAAAGTSTRSQGAATGEAGRYGGAAYLPSTRTLTLYRSVPSLNVTTGVFMTFSLAAKLDL